MTTKTIKAMFVALAAVAAVGSVAAAPTSGTQSSTTTVRARATDVFRVQFVAGEMAAVSIAGDGDTDLDLYVYDENGNEICRSVSTVDRETCRFRPRWTGYFRIEVRNLGNVYNRYRIVAA